MSALSYKVLSHAKTVILFAIGIVFNVQPVAARQWIGAATTFVGVVWYLAQLEPSGGAWRPLPQPANKKAKRVKR